MIYWYLATPYTSSLKGEKAKKHEEQSRYEGAVKIVHDLLLRKVVAFSPIIHFHPVALAHDLPGDNDFWKDTNYSFIKHSSGIIVGQLPGWQESKGIRWEMEKAHELNLPILHYVP